MSTTNQPEVLMTVTPVAGAEVMKFMQQEGVDPAVGGLRVSVQPGGCSGFKYGLLIEDQAAEDDIIVDQGEYKVFVDPFSAQYINGVIIDYTSSGVVMLLIAGAAFAWIAKAFREDDAGVRAQRDVVPATGD